MNILLCISKLRLNFLITGLIKEAIEEIMMDKELGVFRRIEGSCGGVGDIKLYSLDTEVSSLSR